MKRVIGKIKKGWQILDSISRNKASDTLEWELAEREHVFSLLTVGMFTGLPAIPLAVSLELLPDMEPELIRMLQKINTANAPLSDLFSNLDIG